jgi:hypothetical protein
MADHTRKDVAMLQWTRLAATGRLVYGLLSIALAVLPAVTAWAGTVEGPRPTPSPLKGLTPFAVVVGVPKSDAEAIWFPADQLRTDVESRLQKAGIAIAPSAPAGLQIVVRASRAREVPLYAFTVEIEVVRRMRLGEDAQVTVPVITWRKQALGTVNSSHVSEIEPVVMNLLDQFINAYLEQNPKK